MKYKDDFILQNVGGENILVPISSQVTYLNGLFILNSTGAFVWQLLEQEYSREDLVEEVSTQFNVDPNIVLTDIHIFLDEITNLKLLDK